ncbi:glycosyltransferase family 39 protein [Halolamina rubra]|uniref:glycosyltransferase family 39 protein n=1 Tax=Halolamina rubra TaxID=1380430 RepID=UPI000679C093|nr:glycosyltransferase family 39 protein [Halolamina rubra]
MSHVDDLPIQRDDAPWLGAALGAGLLAVGIYLATNPYPAYGAGLYLRIADTIAANGYAPPARIAGYTADGVPFAYPPLQFYALAVLLDLGTDPVALARFLPGVGVLAALVPAYLLARGYTGSRPAGAAAGVVVALNPQLLQWHVSAGGLVRAFAFCYALTAIYAGYRAFETGSRRAVAVGALAFGATVLTHPTYSLFVVVTYLLLWATRDRSPAGLLRGAAVGVGGAVVAAPWLAWVTSTHGTDVLTGAAGTHGGIGGGAATVGFSATLLPLLGAAYLLYARREYFLAAWAAAAELLFAQPRFAFTVGSVIAAVVGVDVARRVPSLDGRVSLPGARAVERREVAAAVCLLLASVAGGGYLAYEMTLPGDPSTPEFLDDEDVAAMAWAERETRPDATFVVLGDAAEWVPALADRTILVGPWGVEWRGPEAYDTQLTTFETLSRCDGVDCVERELARVDADPDYVYLPKGAYTVRGESEVTFGSLDRSFAASPDWERAYENEGVVVYRAVG